MIVVEGREVSDYIERKLRIKLEPPSVAIGFLSNQKAPLCAVVFNDYNGSNIEMTMVSERLTREVLQYLAKYVFVKCGCRRLTIRTRKHNRRAIKMAQRFGFKFEAVVKRYYIDDDAVMFRMFKEDCLWNT